MTLHLTASIARLAPSKLQPNDLGLVGGGAPKDLLKSFGDLLEREGLGGSGSRGNSPVS